MSLKFPMSPVRWLPELGTWIQGDDEEKGKEEEEEEQGVVSMMVFWTWIEIVLNITKGEKQGGRRRVLMTIMEGIT